MTLPPSGGRTRAAIALWLLCGLLGLYGAASGQPGRPAGSPAGLTGVGGGLPDLLGPRDPFRAVFGRPSGELRPATLWGDGSPAVVASVLPRLPVVAGPVRHPFAVDCRAPAAAAHAFEARAPPRTAV